MASRLATAKRVAEEQSNGVIFLLEKIEQLCNNSGGPLLPQLTKNKGLRRDVRFQIWSPLLNLRLGGHQIPLAQLLGFTDKVETAGRQSRDLDTDVDDQSASTLPPRRIHEW